MVEKGKVTKMELKVVNLDCYKCYKKVKKILCKFPAIQDQEFDRKNNKVTIKVVCCSPEEIRDKLYCKGGGCIKCIKIIPPPPTPPPPLPSPPPPPVPPPPPPPPPLSITNIVQVGICCLICCKGGCRGPCYNPCYCDGQPVRRCGCHCGRPGCDGWCGCGRCGGQCGGHCRVSYCEENSCTVM